MLFGDVFRCFRYVLLGLQNGQFLFYVGKFSGEFRSKFVELDFVSFYRDLVLFFVSFLRLGQKFGVRRGQLVNWLLVNNVDSWRVGIDWRVFGSGGFFLGYVRIGNRGKEEYFIVYFYVGFFGRYSDLIGRRESSYFTVGKSVVCAGTTKFESLSYFNFRRFTKQYSRVVN